MVIERGKKTICHFQNNYSELEIIV